jgi:hypothetical protein
MSSDENAVEDFMQFFRPGNSGSNIEDFSEVFD